MGSDHQEEVSRGLRRPRGARQSNEVADWKGVNNELLVGAIACAAHRGGALRFGYTRDGGAYAVGVYYGDDHFTDYVRPGEDIDGYLRDLIASFEDAGSLPKLEKKSNKRR